MRITKLFLVASLAVGGAALALRTLRAAPGAPDEDVPAKKEAAKKAARAWLERVDAGDHGTSWDRAAETFQRAVPKADWERQLSAVRAPLGRVLSREPIGARFDTSLPGAPDGQYVVIQYRTRFEHKKDAVETVTPMREADGAWRVSGYYIK